MGSVPRERFERACRALSDEAFLAFVAALARARDRSVERIGDRRLRISRNGTVQETVVRADWNPTADIDAGADVLVVATTDPGPGLDTSEDLRVVGLDDLYRRLTYAVDPSTARDLARTQLGFSPSDLERDTGTDSDATEAEPPTDEHPNPDRATGEGAAETPGPLARVVAGSPTRRWRSVAAVLVVVALAVAVVGGLPSGGTDPAPVESTPTLTPDSASPPKAAGSGVTADTQSASRDVIDEEYLALTAAESRGANWEVDGLDANGTDLPPGVNENGILSPGLLASAHRASLTDTSYTLRLTYEEVVSGRVTGTYSETLRVDGPSRYAVAVSTLGTLRTDPRRVAETDLYANGSALVVRRGNGTDIATDVRLDAMVATVQGTLRALLAADASRVVARPSNGTGGYWLVTEGNTDTQIENASGTLSVTPTGLVRFGRWSYEPPSTRNVSVEYTIRVTDVGSTTVPRPGWVTDD